MRNAEGGDMSERDDRWFNALDDLSERDRASRRFWRVAAFILACIVVAVLTLLCLGGCVTARDVAGLRTEIDDVAGQVNELDLAVGDVTLHGGEGDSITMWILAAGAAVVYPIVWRPVRKKIASAWAPEAQKNP